MRVEEWLGEKNKIGIDMWHRKYQYNNETLDEWFDRISGGDPKLRQLIVDKKFLFGGRTLANRGIPNSGQYFNCFSAGFVPDDYAGIMDMLKEVGITFKYQGGQGISLSKLRPKGTPIGDNYASDGIVPFMEMFNEVTKGTSQGGSRKGALMISLDINHKEAETFIKLKTDLDAITKANLSLEIDDDFMECVKQWYDNNNRIVLHKKQTYAGHTIEYDIVPIDLYKLMMEVVWDYGEPGCIFTNRFRDYNFMEYCNDYQIETCNPCGEQPLKKRSCCNLGSLNLYAFVKHKFTKDAYFDYDSFSEAIAIASNALDNIIDENANRFPKEMEEYKQNSLNYRNIGLGTFGYAECLMALGLKYGSGNALFFTDKLFDNMMASAIAANVQRGIEKGNFLKCNPDKIALSEIYELHSGISHLKHFRNCSLLSIAPNGSIGTMLNLSGGIEPVFSFDYIRRTDNLDDSYVMGNQAVDDYYSITNKSKLPEWFVDSSQISWQSRVSTQAIIQKHIDTAISSTVNLPEETTKEEVERLYLYAWAQGLKGITIFRSGCKRLGILIDNSSKQNEGQECVLEKTNILNSVPDDDDLPRGYIVDAIDDDSAIILMRNLMTGCGHLYITAKFDPVTGDLLEIFPNKGSSGGCICTMTGLTRQTSTSARAGVPIEAIIDQFKSCPPCPSYAVRSAKYHDTAKGSSCPVAIGFALEDMHNVVMDRIESDDGDWYNEEESLPEIQDLHDFYETEQEWLDMGLCPICHEPLQHVGGCLTCKNDGYSKCD